MRRLDLNECIRRGVRRGIDTDQYLSKVSAGNYRSGLVGGCPVAPSLRKLGVVPGTTDHRYMAEGEAKHIVIQKYLDLYDGPDKIASEVQVTGRFQGVTVSCRCDIVAVFPEGHAEVIELKTIEQPKCKLRCSYCANVQAKWERNYPYRHHLIQHDVAVLAYHQAHPDQELISRIQYVYRDVDKKGGPNEFVTGPACEYTLRDVLGRKEEVERQIYYFDRLYRLTERKGDARVVNVELDKYERRYEMPAPYICRGCDVAHACPRISPDGYSSVEAFKGKK